MNQYPVGEEIIVTATFLASTPPMPADPTTVTAELLLPDQSVIALVPVKQSTGVYAAPYTPQFASGSVSGAASGTGGVVKLTVNDTSKLITGMKITVEDIVGAVQGNGEWPVTVIDGTHIELQGSVFSTAYSSGGTWSKSVPNGLHQYRFAGTGAVIAAVEGSFMVQTDFSS